MKRASIFLAFLVMLTVMLIGMPDLSQIQVDDTVSLSPQRSVITSFGKNKTYLASGNYLPDKLDAKIASTESILVRPKTDKVLRKGLMMNAFKGKNFSYSKALFKKALAKSLNLRSSKEIRNNLYVVNGANVNPAKVKAAFNDQSYQLIEPNYKITISKWPDLNLQINDGWKDELWGLDTPEKSYGINAEAVWPLEDDITDDVIVGIVDTGVNCNHVDLEGVCWRNPGEIEGDGIDNDGNGYVDDVSGYNFIGNNNDPSDNDMENNHGTHVSGTIAAIRNNGIGIAGVTSKAKILPLKFMNEDAVGFLSGEILAIEYAIQLKKAGYNLRVLNMSIGSVPPGIEDGITISIEEYNALKDAGDAGITAVIAAGNDYGIHDNSPAAYNLDNIISVAAHRYDLDQERNSILGRFSNYGPTVHISAPGVYINSLCNNDIMGVCDLNGTSMAAPHVSGVVAILAGLFPEAKPADYRNWIINGGYKVPYLADKVVSGAILDAVGAVEEGYKATNNQNETITISGYVLELGLNKYVGTPEVTVKLELKNSNESNFVKTVETDSSGRFYFSVDSSYIGKDFTLTASDGETVCGAYSGKVSASSMSVPSLMRSDTSSVPVQLHVLDENLQVVNDRNYSVLIQLFDRTGSNFSYSPENYPVGEERRYDVRGNLHKVFSLVTNQAGEYKIFGYSSSVELDNLTEKREVVFLPDGKEKFTGPMELPAPFIANLGNNSIEVNMKPFSGVEYKNRKNLTAVYRVSVKNLNTKESIVKDSYLPKLTINNLEKGRYRVRYLVNIVDSSGKGVSWSGQWSPAKDAYVGYYWAVSPETHLYKSWSNKYYYDEEYLRSCTSVRGVVFENYAPEEVKSSITFMLKNLSTKKSVTRTIDGIGYDSKVNNDICAHFRDFEPDAYELRYKINFVKEGKILASTEYSDPEYFVLGYPSGTVHPKMRHNDLDLVRNPGGKLILDSKPYHSAVYSGRSDYPIQKRYRITNANTGEIENANESNVWKKLRSKPEGHYMIQYHYLIMDGSEILAKTPWSNYVDYVVK